MKNNASTTAVRLKVPATNFIALDYKLIKGHSSWQVNADVFDHPAHSLHLGIPYDHWSNMTTVDRTAQRREDWLSASVVNHTIVIDPKIWEPIYLTHHTWSVLNHFQTCHANLHRGAVPNQLSANTANNRPYSQHVFINKI